jgi:hypothetical protein
MARREKDERQNLSGFQNLTGLAGAKNENDL